MDVSGREYLRIFSSLFGFTAFGEDRLDEFTQKFRDYAGVKYCLLLPSERVGFYLLLKTLGADPGDEIIVSSYSYPLFAQIILKCGLSPIFVDIIPDYYTIDPERLKKAITKRTRAIVATHIFGQPCMMDEIMSIAGEANLPVIEDCAHSFGSKYKNRNVGTFGMASLFSLSSMKNPSALGGGIFCTDNPEIYEKVAASLSAFEKSDSIGARAQFLARNLIFLFTTQFYLYSFTLYPFFWLGKSFYPRVEDSLLVEIPREGIEFSSVKKMAFKNIQASFGIGQLERVDEMIARRRRISDILTRGIMEMPGVTIPEEMPETLHNYLYYMVQVDNKDEIARKLFYNGIDANANEPWHCSQFDIFSPYKNPDTPVSDSAFKRLIRLPNSSNLTERDAEFIVSIFNHGVFNHKGRKEDTKNTKKKQK